MSTIFLINVGFRDFWACRRECFGMESPNQFVFQIKNASGYKREIASGLRHFVGHF